jgi:hypothetical protein
VGQITTSLQSAESVLEEYQEIVADLQEQMSGVRKELPRWLSWMQIGVSLVLIWLGIAQIGLITQGWELVARGRHDAAAQFDSPQNEKRGVDDS